MEYIIVRGRTKEQAIDKALKQLGAKPEEVKVELLAENKRFFSLLGNCSVKVKVSYINQANNAREPERTLTELEKAKEVLSAIVEKMGIPCAIDGGKRPDGLYLTIRSDKAELIIGKTGKTLDALQYIVTKIIEKRLKRKMSILVDAENYRKRRGEKINILVMSMIYLSMPLAKSVSKLI